MAALSCEICGGKLMAKSGGVFECDSCGMQYEKARVQQMIQEIRGTVKVEGPVEVKGSVKVEGGETAESLIRLARLQISQRKFDEARETLNKLESRYLESGDSVFLRLLADHVSRDYKDLSLRRPAYRLKQKERELLDGALQSEDSQTREEIALYLKQSEEVRVLREAEEKKRQEQEKQAELDRQKREKQFNAEKNKKIAALTARQKALKEERDKLTGFFSRTRRNEITEELNQLHGELKKLRGW